MMSLGECLELPRAVEELPKAAESFGRPRYKVAK